MNSRLPVPPAPPHLAPDPWLRSLGNSQRSLQGQSLTLWEVVASFKALRPTEWCHNLNHNSCIPGPWESSTAPCASSASFPGTQLGTSPRN